MSDVTTESNEWTKDWDLSVGRKLLHNGRSWVDIEKNCKETNEFFEKQLKEARLRFASFTAAADTLQKMVARPRLVEVWQLSAPGLLESKTHNLSLFAPDSEQYTQEFTQKIRMQKITEALSRLDLIQNQRPIKTTDILQETEKIRDLAKSEKEKIDKLESNRKEALSRIGDGREIVERLAALITNSHTSNCLILSQQTLLRLPADICDLTNLEVLDLENNALTSLPPEMAKLQKLRKLYLSNNQLSALPSQLCKLSRTLILLSLNGNPLSPALRDRYIEGLASLMSHLTQLHDRERQAERLARRQRRAAREAARQARGQPRRASLSPSDADSHCGTQTQRGRGLSISSILLADL